MSYELISKFNIDLPSLERMNQGRQAGGNHVNESLLSRAQDKN